MKMKQNIRNLPVLRMALLILLSACAFCAHSQITIGSGVEPVKGAILDLKSQAADGDNVTSTTGGLVLPRVQLEAENSVALFFGGTDQSDDVKTLLTGLTVYNLTSIGGFSAGPYNWDGTQWVTFAGAGGTAYNGSSPVTVSGNSIGLIAGTANGQVLKWNGTAWQLATDADTNTTYTGTAPITVSDANAISLDDAGVTTDKLADLSVTNTKIANTTITQTKMIGTGSTTGQVLTSTGAGEAPTWQTPRSSVVDNQVVAAGSSAIADGLSGASLGTQTFTLITSGRGIVRCIYTPSNSSTLSENTNHMAYDGSLTVTLSNNYIRASCTVHAITETTVASGIVIAPY